MLSLDFTWTAPDTCPTRAAVVEQLSRAVDFGGKELPPLRARAVVSREGASWRLELETELDGRIGTRLLEADSCEGLARAATLVLALTLGEGLARREAEAEAKAARPPEPKTPPTAPAPAPAPPTRPRKTPERRQLAWLSVGVGSNPLGALAPTARLGVAYQPSWFRLSVSIGASLPRQSELGERGIGARATALGGGVAACLVPALPPLRVVACGELGLTVLRVAGQGTERDRQATLPLYGLGPSLGVEWWLRERAFVSVSFTSRFDVKRPELVVEGTSERERLEGMTASALLGGGVRW